MHEWRFIIGAQLAAGIALLIVAPLNAQETAPPEPAVSLACAAEPAVLIDASSPVVLRAWVTFGGVGEPHKGRTGRLLWRSGSGTLRPLSGDASHTQWLPGSQPAAGPIGSGVAHAHALWLVDGEELARCDVRVRRAETAGGGIEHPRAALRSDRITARSLLLPHQREPEGYGLIGWLLLPALPRDEAERQRHRGAIDAWLRELVPAESLLAHYERASQIALTLLPLHTAVQLPEPGDSAERRRDVVEKLLSAYDHARAQSVLAEFGLTGQGRGPHLAARELLLPGADAGRLLLDMSGVSNAVMTDWLMHFRWLAAQQRSWGALAVRRFGLNLHNVLAASATATPLVLNALTHHVFVLRPR